MHTTFLPLKHSGITFLAGLAVLYTYFASWHWSVTRDLWDKLDKAAFYFFHAGVTDIPSVRYFWAFANSRTFDVMVALLFAAILAYWIFQENRQYWRERMAGGIFLTAYVLLAYGLLDLWLDTYFRDSPSLTMPSAQRLSQLVPDIKTKDHSTHSFPSDHAMVLFLTCAIACRLVRKWFWLWVAFPIVFMLPRLVAAAHWLTDILVGSLFYSGLLLLPLFVFKLDRLLMPLIRRCIDRGWNMLSSRLRFLNPP